MTNNNQIIQTQDAMQATLQSLDKLYQMAAGDDTASEEARQLINTVGQGIQQVVAQVVQLTHENDTLRYENTDLESELFLRRSEMQSLRRIQTPTIKSEIEYELVRFFNITPNDAASVVKAFFGEVDLGPYFTNELRHQFEDVAMFVREEEDLLSESQGD